MAAPDGQQPDLMTLPDWIAALLPQGAPDEPLLLAGLLVLGALAGEVIARRSRLPRLVGYTIMGGAAALLGHGVELPLTGWAGRVLDLGLALLLFEIGSRLRLRWFRHNPVFLAVSLFESIAGGAFVLFVLLLLDFPPVAAMACALLAVPSGAAVAGRVAQELGADGQVTQRMGALTALNTLFGVALLTVFENAMLVGTPTGALGALGRFALTALLSVVLAAALAAAVGAAARRLDLRNESAVLLVLGLVLLAVATARWIGASTLLVPLVAGVLLRNVSDRAWAWPRHFGTAGGMLVLLLFLVVGAAWSPAILAAGGLTALAVVAARAAGKGLVITALSPWTGMSLRQGTALAVALTPLSATALVMLSGFMTLHPALGAQVAPVVLTAVAVLELTGPLAVQWSLHFAGELPGRDAGSSP